MIIHDSLSPTGETEKIKQIALGFFDGLHTGHMAVINHPQGINDPSRSALFTFQSHPFAVLNPDRKPPLITGLPHKLLLLEQSRLALTLTLPFDLQRSKESPHDFLQELIHCFPNLQVITVGPNWHFGHNRQGDSKTVFEWSKPLNITTHIATPTQYQGKIISSTRIRQTIQNGKFTDASAMLGRPFSLYGTVIQGDGLGRKLGFPTANLHTLDECFPPNGVYTGTVTLRDNRTFTAAINIGMRPSILNPQPTLKVEAHLLNFDEQIYDQPITITPQSLLRKEQKFESLEELKNAIQQDVLQTAHLA